MTTVTVDVDRSADEVFPCERHLGTTPATRPTGGAEDTAYGRR
jgi:hypothetical protein